MAQICPVCQTTNADDANFCLNCNHRISLNCMRCSRRVLSKAKFCDRCGYPIRIPPTEHFTEQNIPAEFSWEIGTAPSRVEVAGDEIPPVRRDSTKTDPETARLEDSVAESESESPLERFVPQALRRKLEAARSSGDMVGERRVVTMMFCDVKGSTTAAEQLDPEEWSEIINGAFEHMIRPIYRYEGTVARLMGDGLLAFFGAPLSHEDDPHRAILAGLDICSEMKPYREKILHEWGIDINVRIGINTGLVVVGTVGSDLRMEYSALGDAINLAARMEQTALPGTVQIAEDTYKLVHSLFEFEAMGEIEIKGKNAQVKAYRVLGRKVKSGRMRGIEGLHADMVGREVELQNLHDVVDDIKHGVGRIAVILGEAGLGKTRLVSEMRKDYSSKLGEDGNWFETNSLSYENKQAYGLLQRLIRSVIGIGYDDPPRMIRKKINAMAEGFPQEQQERVILVFEALFGISSERNGSRLQLDGEAFKKELLAVMLLWWRGQFPGTPTVIVFDDMHWSDQASIDLLQNLMHLTEELPLALICAMRVDRKSGSWDLKRQADDAHHHRYTEILLPPLSEGDSNELVNRLLAIAEIPELLRASIIEKSDGNPFFIEEVVRTLIENEIVVPEDRTVNGEKVRYWVATSESVEFSIPDNLQSLLSARMDLLEESTRSTLQLASVIGRNFYLRVLEAVDDTSPELSKHVGTLLRLDLIRESARVPEIEYSFRNPLTQEAVYKTILLKHRREFHNRVARAIEALYAHRLDSHYGLLAHHFTLGKVRDRAIHYRRLAASQAVDIFAYEEAVQNLESALELIDPIKDQETHLAVLEELADVCRQVRDFEVAIDYYGQALGIWDLLSEADPLICMRLNRKIVEIATTAKWSVDAETYQRMSEISRKSVIQLEKMLSAEDREDSHAEFVLDLVVLSMEAWRIQMPPNWERAQQFAETAVKMAEKLGDDALELTSRAFDSLATVLDGQSLLRDHLDVAWRRLEITKHDEFAHHREQVDAQRGMGAALMYVGQYEKALGHLEQAEAMAIELQAPDQIASALGIKAQCFFRQDRWDDVLATEEKWRELDNRFTRERVGET